MPDLLSAALFQRGAFALVARRKADRGPFAGRWLLRTAHRGLAAAIGIIIGGALGNVIDRLVHGAVADFFYFHIGPHYWPAFNIADSAICIGVAILCVEGMIARHE